MQVFLKTAITPEVKIYDTESGRAGGLVELFSPSVIVRDNDGTALYVWGDYKVTSWPFIILVAVAAFMAARELILKR